MKVVLKVSRAGPKMAQQAGDVIEVSNSEGRVLIERDQAEEYKPSKPNPNPKKKSNARDASKKPEVRRHAVDSPADDSTDKPAGETAGGEAGTGSRGGHER